MSNETTEQTTDTEPQIARYGDHYPAEGEPPLVYGPDDVADEQTTEPHERAPGLVCDESIVDEHGNFPELAE